PRPRQPAGREGRLLPSMLPLLSSPLGDVFSLHSGRCGTGPRLLWLLPVVGGPRVSPDCLAVRVLTPVNRCSKRLSAMSNVRLGIALRVRAPPWMPLQDAIDRAQ